MIGVYILPNGIVPQNAKKKRSGKLPGKMEPSRLVRTVVRNISSGEFIVPGNAISGIALDFTWLFENTPDNKQKLIDECLRRFEAASGPSATELNTEEIRKVAKENGLELFEKLPDGWKITSKFAPRGSVRIAKGSFIMRADDGKLIANPEYREALLIQGRN